jgi:rare lipoprotein A
MRNARLDLVPAILIAGPCLLLAGTTGAQDDPVVYREEGKASYYGDKFDGKPTASGERFDQGKLTAAHPELPLGSEVTVKNPETGKEVDVEVNDRGPYAKGRDIDLSKAAAKELGITQDGVAPVEIEATKSQVEQAIESPKEEPKVEKALKDARKEAAAEGTPQPRAVPELEAPK